MTLSIPAGKDGGDGLRNLPARPGKAAPLGPGETWTGEARSGTLLAGEETWFTLDLRASTAVILEVSQEELDVEVLVQDSQGRELLAFDSPVGREEPERVCFVADRTGTFRIGITPFSGAGDYTLRWVRQRPAVSADRSCAQAARAFMAAHTTRAPPAARIAGYERAALDWQRAGEVFLEAMARRETASLRVDLGQGARAATDFRKALRLARRAGSDYLEISLLNRLGLLLLDQGEIHSAESSFTRALLRARETGDRRGEASALSNLGLVDEVTGETHQAIDRYLRAIPILREHGGPADLAQTLRNLANAYGLLDFHEEALDTLEEALSIARRTGDEERQAIILATRAWIHFLRGRPEDGLDPLDQALVLQRLRKDRNAEAALLDRRGSMLRALGRHAEALESYQRSLEISDADGSPQDAAGTTLNLGCLYQELGRLDEATARLDEARERYRRFDDPKARAHIEFCQAWVKKRRGNLEASLEHIETSLSIVAKLRGSARSRGEKSRPIWLWQDYEELRTDLLLDLYRETGQEEFAARAFELSDLKRARGLFESVLESRIGLRARAAPELLEREREKQGQLNRAEKKRRRLQAAGAEPQRLLHLESRLRALSLELERTRAEIRTADPHYAQLVAPLPVTLKQVQALLDPGTVLLSFVLHVERSYLLAVRQRSLEVFLLEPRNLLETQAKALYHALKQSQFGSEQWWLTARTLSARILPPEALRDSDHKLLILPEGLLHYVPFAVLPSPRPGDSDGGERRWVDDFEILHLPSASVLAALRQRSAGRRPAPETLAVFADPVFSLADPRLRGSGRPVEKSGGRREIPADPLPEFLPRLLHTRQEAEAILGLAAPRAGYAALDFAATKEAVLSAELTPYRILHFATHAFINERLPALSGLALSRWDESGAPIDGDLYLHEIFNLRLAADLTVLSGCQTALGRRIRGDGLLSLTRGFLYAGSAQVLVSLWSVDDEATACLMAEFYRGLLTRGERPVAALRAAQLSLRRQPRWSAPYYWAPFVLQGDG